MRKILLAFLSVASFSFAQTPNVYWVDVHNGDDTNNGLTSATAFKTIQHIFSNTSSLFSSNVDTIKVMPSVTSSNSSGYYDFGDNEIYLSNSSSNSRNFVMIGISGADSTIFDAESKNRHFRFYGSQSSNTIIQGITFKNGFNEYNGGSIYFSQGNISFKSCVFEGNKSRNSGGALEISGNSSPSFESCIFRNNYLESTDNSGSRGGAINVEQPYSDFTKNNPINIVNTKFISNYIKSKNSAFGGSVSTNRASQFTNCVFIKNHATGNTDDSGDYDEAIGGAIYADNTWWNGSQSVGMNMYIVNSTFDGNYIKVVTDDKINTLWGSTISYGRWNSNVSPTAKTFIYNSIIRNSKIFTKSSTFTNDSNSDRGDLLGTGNSEGYKLITDYNNIEDATAESWAGDYTYDTEVGYKDTANGDYSLVDGSPMIGLGSATWSDEDLTAPTKDILGVTRGSSPDLGAYENALNAPNAPLPVSGLSVVAITSGAKLNWNKNKTSLTSSALASNIEYQIQKDSSGVKTTFTTSDTAYTFSNLKNGKTYILTLSAKDTQSGNVGISSKAFTISPRYLGPKWYVGAGSDGTAKSSQSSDLEWGSKTSPINNLSTALEVYASGDTIVMMKGTHTGSSNRGITIPNNKKPFVLTGDLDHPASETILDANYRDRHFIFDGEQDSTWVIQRVTLYRGKASGSNWNSTGGSVRLNGSSSPFFKEVIFSENIDETNQYRNGAAIRVTDQARLLVEKCTFIKNEVTSLDNSGSGGAINIESAPINKKHYINASIFNGNRVRATYQVKGAAIYTNYAIDITNSVFINNSLKSDESDAYGTIAYEGPGIIKTNNGNRDGTDIYSINNTIANNHANTRSGYNPISGIFYCDWEPGSGQKSSTFYAFNNIIYGNKTNGAIDDYQVEAHCGGPVIRADYNNIQGLAAITNAGNNSNSGITNFDFSSDIEPAFKDSANGNFSLDNKSLMIGSGIANWSDWGVSAPATDLLGIARPNPAGSNPDLGAYENSLAKSPYPPKVSGLVAKGGSGQVTLNWSALSEADSVYKIYMSTQAFTESSSTLLDTTSSLEFTKTGLNNAIRYYFRVTGVNKQGYEGTASAIDITPTFSGPVWFVSKQGNDKSGEGSQGSPFATITHAVDHANEGDTVIVKAGTYQNEEIEIEGHTNKNIVLMSESGSSQTIIDAQNSGNPIMKFLNDNSQAALIGIDSTFQVIGFTFTNSNQAAVTIDNVYSGGNAYVPLRPKFKNCVFINNQNYINGLNGGAVVIGQASPIFENCIFDNNLSARGGAVSIYSEPRENISNAVQRSHFRNCTFKNNKAISLGGNSGEPYGGAIAIQEWATATIVDCVFDSNLVETDMNSQQTGSGGAIYTTGAFSHMVPLDSNYVIIDRSIIKNNRVRAIANGYGGGLVMRKPARITNSLIINNTLTNANATSYQTRGGAVYLELWEIGFNNITSASAQEFINNTVIGNQIVTFSGNKGEGGGIAIEGASASSFWMFNNIIGGNISCNQAFCEEDVDSNLRYFPGFGSPMGMIANNNIQYGSRDNRDWWNDKNFYDEAPGFVDSTQQNYQLYDGSPMLGAGIASMGTGLTMVKAPKTDLLGNRRPNPSGSNPDLGAYENALAESPYPGRVANLFGFPGSKSANLIWSPDTSKDFKQYHIYQSTNKVFSSSLDTLASTADTTYSAIGLLNGQEYHFWVTAVDTNGFEGLPSNIASVVPLFNGPNWWVDPSVGGSGDFGPIGDGSFSDPFKFLTDAFRVVNSGDTLKLKSGIYDEGFDLLGEDEGITGRDNGGEFNNIKSITIIGVDGADQTVLQGNFSNRFFRFEEMDKIAIRGLTFRDGFDESTGGAIFMDNIDSVSISNSVFLKNSAKNHGGAIQLSRVDHALFNNVNFIENHITAEQEGTSINGGAISTHNMSSDFTDNIYQIVFMNSLFEDNHLHSTANNIYASGGAVVVSQNIHAVFNNTIFRSNYINATGANSASEAAAVKFSNYTPTSWDSYPKSVFEGCLFEENYVQDSGNQSATLLISTAVKTLIRNSLIINNSSQAAQSLFRADPGYDNNGNGADFRFQNNTIYGNNSQEFMHAWGFGAKIEFVNNIIWQNNTQNNSSNNIAYAEQEGVTITMNNNIMVSKFIQDGRPGFSHSDNIDQSPKFRNAGNKDFRLQANSPGIDKGQLNNNLVYDYRGYYRVGIPDIGALEAGASKYILAINDDIDNKTILPLENSDKNFIKVNRQQTLNYTIVTKDIDGNQVNSNESVSWNIFPSQKYVSLVEGDANTSGGDATASFQVTSQFKGVGFRFRIEAEVGDAILRSNLYVIEELKTGAPPPVPTLTVTPSYWTNNPDFKINWSTPNWSEDRELLGAIVDISDGISSYNEFVSFPQSGPLTEYEFTVPEAGKFDARLWLVDEYGNESADSSRSVDALFDNIHPEKFGLLYPRSYIPENGDIEYAYDSEYPFFEWEDRGDFPSGIRSWTIWIRDQGTNNVRIYNTYESGKIEYNEYGHVDGRDTTLEALNDGYYDWWVEAVDYAGQVTESDTAFFGVDISAPEIVHDNPLFQIDEGTTSPTITAEFFDYASGVKEAYLYYRRSGSGSGFIKEDLINDSFNIPGSDIRSQGVEYFIESMDNVGNYGRWPTDYDGRMIHSVQVIGDSPLTFTVDNLGGNDESAYQLFSFPYNIQDPLSNILVTMESLGYPDFNLKYWRLWGYNGGGYDEITDASYPMQMGEAYFLIYNKDKITTQPAFDFGSGYPSTLTDPPFEIYVQPSEWKFFGLPYDFDISLSNIYTDDGEHIEDVGSVWTWNNGDWVYPGSNLQPWKGYIYKPVSANRIMIDGRGNEFAPMATRKMDPTTIPLQVDEWVIDIVASSSGMKDENNSVGVRHIAEDGFDKLDEFEPPAVSGKVAIRIDNRDREGFPDLYAIDIRKPSEEGQFWDLQVLAPTNGLRTYITFEGLGYVPEEYDMFLINKTNRQALSLDIESTYQIANSGSDGDGYIKQDLRLVIGTRDFVNENNDGVNLYPDAFTLSQNYPNPFNPQTSIRLSLQEDARVDLVVYDLTGKQITRLVSGKEHSAGYYNFIWNGKNELGTRVSSGVYLYHALVRDSNGKVVLNKTRKMILLK